MLTSGAMDNKSWSFKTERMNRDGSKKTVHKRKVKKREKRDNPL